MTGITQDIRYGVRRLSKDLSMVCVVVLTLALCTGANITVFSWLNAVILNPLPGVSASDRLVVLSPILSYPNFRTLRNETKTLSGLTAYGMTPLNLKAKTRAERVWGLVVADNYFDVLGVHPALGRLFSPRADTENSNWVVISYGFWQREFGASPGAIGQAVALDGHPFTIIGVAPRTFQGTYTGLAFDVWVPLSVEDELIPGGNRLNNATVNWLTALGRLEDGVVITKSQTELETLAKGIRNTQESIHRLRPIRLYPLWKSPFGINGILGPMLFMLLIVSGLVLLIGCANIANLLLVNGMARCRELAVRRSFGATRGRLIRQLLVEAILLSGLGSIFGLIISYWTSTLLSVLIPRTGFPVALRPSVGFTVLLFAMILSLLATLFFALIPSIEISRQDVMTILRDEGPSFAGGRRRRRLQQANVIMQISLSFLLLVCAGLFIRSLERAQHFDPGFNPRNVLLASIDLFPSGYSPKRGVAFYDQLVDKLATLPTVQSVSLSHSVPMGFGGSDTVSVEPEGYQPSPRESVYAVENIVGVDYFKTLEIPLVQGRDFTRRDNDQSSLVGIVNKNFVDRFWHGANPIGKRVRLENRWLTVIGVVGNSHCCDLNEPPLPFLYLSVSQFYNAEMTLEVRYSAPLSGLSVNVQRTVTGMNAGLLAFDVGTMESHITAASFVQRTAGLLLGAFGGLALLLGTMGIFGIISYGARQRTREFSIRMALGARPGDITKLLVKEGAVLCSVGLLLGFAVTVAVIRLLSSLLFGVSEFDPVVFVGVTLILISATLLLCYFAATRAGRIELAAAMRYE